MNNLIALLGGIVAVVAAVVGGVFALDQRYEGRFISNDNLLRHTEQLSTQLDQINKSIESLGKRQESLQKEISTAFTTGDTACYLVYMQTASVAGQILEIEQGLMTL